MANIIRLGGGGASYDDIGLKTISVANNHSTNNTGYSSTLDSGPDKAMVLYYIAAHNYSTSGSGFQGISRIEGSDNGSSWTTVRSIAATGGNGHNYTYGTTRAYRYYRLVGTSNGGDVSDINSIATCVDWSAM